MVLVPQWSLVYEGIDITRDIAPRVISVEYTDNLHGRSDECAIELEDHDGRWRGPWYPAKGDAVNLKAGYEGRMIPCGTFRIDEIELEGPPDVMRLRGLAAAITQSLRTKKSRAFENRTLAGIAAVIADEHGLIVSGTIDAIGIARVSQADEADLAFLKRLAEDYGHAFAIRDRQLVFHRIGDLETAAPVMTVDRADLIRYALKDKARRIYRACVVTYQDPASGETLTATVTADGIETGDVIKRTFRVESLAQATDKARAALAQVNDLRLTGEFTVVGEPRLLAGNTVELTGMGRLSGTYLIQTSRHSLNRDAGYTTTLEVRRV